jgi:hypothetical protein
MCVAQHAASETVAKNLPRRIDASVASFLPDLPVVITVAIFEAGPPVLSPWAISVAV